MLVEKYLNIKQVEEEITKKNIEIYGKDICNSYFIEESAELIKELTKSTRGEARLQDLKEEVADVYYTLSMLCQVYGITQEYINEGIKFKELRAKGKMGLE